MVKLKYYHNLFGRFGVSQKWDEENGIDLFYNFLIYSFPAITLPNQLPKTHMYIFNASFASTHQLSFLRSYCSNPSHYVSSMLHLRICSLWCTFI